MAIYYVDPLNGNDGNTGLNPTTQQWLTTQKALDNVVGGDEVRLMNTQTETLSTTLTETTTGSDELPIQLIGADSNGDALTTGHYTISANGIGANLYDVSLDWYIWKHVRFTDADATFNNISETLNVGSHHSFINCRMDNAGANGVLVEAPSWQFRGCEIDNNGSLGIDVDGLNRATMSLLNCSLHDNVSHGMELAGSNNTVKNCLFYNNGGSGILANRYTARLMITENIFYNNDGSGIEFNGAESNQDNVWVFNNIMASNGAYGADVDASFNPETWLFDYNSYYNNTSNAVSWLGTSYAEGDINGNGFGNNNVGGDPLFTSVTPGAEDFTLQSGSPCLDVGLGYNG